MAVVAKTITRIPVPPFGYAWMVFWDGLVKGDTGSPLEMPARADRSVQIIGTFDSATVTLKGSNDGTNYVTLDDNEGTAISLTSAGLVGVRDPVRYIRPEVSGSGGSADIDVYLLIIGPREL